jgi:DNA invertase Pin-like site-specific DNA recombinase
MTYAYLRQIPGYGNLSEQQRHILSFALSRGLQIEKEVIEYSTKQRSIEEREEFERFLHSLEEGDTIVVEHLAILSDNVEEVVKVINCMLSRDITLYLAANKIKVTKMSPLMDVFPLLNDLREAQKANTGRIGRPKGSRSSSKFDVYQAQIIAMLKEDMSVSAIARELGVSRSSLKDYIESRGLRDLVKGTWMEIADLQRYESVDNAVLICPFERDENEEKSNKQTERMA